MTNEEAHEAAKQAVRDDPYLPIRRSTALTILIVMMLVVVSCFTSVLLSRQSVSTAQESVRAVSQVNAIFRDESTCRAVSAAKVDVARGNLTIAQTELQLAGADYNRAFNDLLQQLLTPPPRDTTEIAAIQSRLNDAATAQNVAQGHITDTEDALKEALADRDTSVARCAANADVGS